MNSFQIFLMIFVVGLLAVPTVCAVVVQRRHFKSLSSKIDETFVRHEETINKNTGLIKGIIEVFTKSVKECQMLEEKVKVMEKEITRLISLTEELEERIDELEAKLSDQEKHVSPELSDYEKEMIEGMENILMYPDSIKKVNE